ncbi:ABC transporter ATP-binding protein [Nitratireductor indicus]|uniref:ABC transporter-like protein n=1 Tax=Nitratireductor indicus C115 TaxID=1231190 RepID=K2NY38_9HYPH|nr:ABC transporter ATP-binding protein [Nitratireductor indicus]EKF39986.1 ABC transporter-like protein [Nitratireductor indicus C115]MDS1138787.1 ABC transporter ATP-binding protein [Nitratireductor indicus]SFQ81610.1 NitT/TauT family transport system ATP-binding protein [Nitratireductor indicus]
MVATLEFQNVSKSYQTATGPIEALRDFDLTIGEGEFISIVGPSGCGKSTLLSMASGLAFPTQGKISVKGEPVSEPVTDLGIVFQTDVLLDWRTILDNILIQPEMRGLDRNAYRPRALDLLKMVGLEGFEKKYPYELSGGMRQRVSICRALIHEPPLLLMDEPFGALDALTREQMVMELHQIWLETRKSVIFITHDIQEAVLLADRVIVMTPRPGRIAEIIKTDLPHPRRPATMETARFISVVAQIRHLFEKHGVLKAY